MRGILLAPVIFVLAACSGAVPTPTTPAPVTSNAVAAAQPTSVSNVHRHLFYRKGHGWRSHAVNHLFDVTDHGGAHLTSATQHAIYVNCDKRGSCWNGAQQFLTKLSQSSFIHMLDPYIGSTASGRYPPGASVSMTDTKDLQFDNVLSENAVFQILHDAIVKLGIKKPGYDHLFHVFLPKDVDECLTAGPCYSPDRPPVFVFCGYHGSVDYKDLGHVIFTVQPYQWVSGCYETAPYPNGAVEDSSASTLSHEIFEAITDPDVGTGWWNELTGFEMADFCTFGKQFQVNVPLDGKTYKIQQEWLNSAHGCAP